MRKRRVHRVARMRTAKGGHFEYPITLDVNAVGSQNSVGALIASVTKTSSSPIAPHRATRSAPVPRLVRGIAGLPNSATTASSFVSPSLLGKLRTKRGYPQRRVQHERLRFGTSAAEAMIVLSAVPSDLINVGITDEKNPPATVPTVRTDPLPEDAYQNNHYPQFYCDGGAAGSGVFRLDAGCWTGAQVLFEVKAAASPPTARCGGSVVAGPRTYGSSRFPGRGKC